MNVLDRWRSFPIAVSCMRGSARRGRGRSLPRSRLRHLVSIAFAVLAHHDGLATATTTSLLSPRRIVLRRRFQDYRKGWTYGRWDMGGAQPTTCHCHCQGALYMGSNKMEQSYWPRGVNWTAGLSFMVQDHEKAKVRCLPVNDREDFWDING